MKSKLFSARNLVLILIVLGGGIFLFTFASQKSPKETTHSTAKTKQTTQPVSLSTSAKIKIPAINVDAKIESVGVNAQDAMDVPKSPADTAWFKLGPKPGEIGSAVIDGHLDWYNGQSAVFENLDKLQPGDEIYIQDDKGTSATFVVTKSKTYRQDDPAPAVFSSNDGKSHLNLITCQGTWDKAKQSYSSRLVVFADKRSANNRTI